MVVKHLHADFVLHNPDGTIQDRAKRILNTSIARLI